MFTRLIAEKVNMEKLVEHLQQCVDQDKFIIDLMVNNGKMGAAKELALQTIQVEEEIKSIKQQLLDKEIQILEIELEIVFG